MIVNLCLFYFKDTSKELVSTAIQQLPKENRLEFLIKYFCQKKLGFFPKSIEIKPKRSGVQSGKVAHVNDARKTTFYIKTHQNGASLSNPGPIDMVDSREMIIYEFLELIGLGPEVDYFYYDFNLSEFYIATKGIDSFTEFDNLLKLPVFSEIYKNTKVYLFNITFADMMSKILFLSDLLTNYENFGFQLLNENINLKIVDFKINDDLIDTFKQFNNSAVELFKKNNLSLSLHTCFENYFTISSVEKKSIGKTCLNILKKDFSKNLDLSFEKVYTYFHETNFKSKCNEIQIEQFNKNKENAKFYIKKIKENFDQFSIYFDE